MLNFLRSSTIPVPQITDPKQIDKMYVYWRVRVLVMMYIGYAVFYLTRKSFNFAMPEMMHDIGLTKTEVGIIATVFYITYGFSKFMSGILSDHSNPRYFMGIGLMMTGVLNIIFGLYSSFYALLIVWGLNAFFQGWGWPPCSKLLTSWYSRSERGSWWAVWNTAHNLGGALIPLIIGFFAVHYSWRYGLWVTGTIAIVTGLLLCIFLNDKPSTMGLPSVGTWRNDKKEMLQEAQSLQGLHWFKLVCDHVITNKWIWLLAITSVLVYVVRTAINDWGNLYLTEVYHYDLIKANSVVSIFEIGGFIGSLVAGWGSDYFFRGDRGPMIFIFSIGVFLAALLLWFQPSASYLMQALSFFMLGFFTFGPQMLLGIAAVECSHKDASGASTGFTGLFAYVGAALSGYPIALILETYAWPGFFVVLVITATASSACLIPFLMQKQEAL